MVVAIFPSLEGEDLADFSMRLAEKWRVGQKGLDNGAILVVFVRDRRVRLEVGYGLEARIPDATAAQIIRETLAPRFREGRYAEGLERAVLAIYAKAGGQSAPAPPSRAKQGAGASSRATAIFVLGMFALFGLVGLLLLRELLSAPRVARRRAYTGGRDGWSVPTPGPWVGGGGWGDGGGGGPDFTPGGGSFGGGGASGEW